MLLYNIMRAYVRVYGQFESVYPQVSGIYHPIFLGCFWFELF
jgi:hypothetical protein